MVMATIFEDADQFERLSRYMSGRLSDAEAARLEGDWAGNPNWLADMELDARIQAGLRELRRTQQLESAVRGPWWTKPIRMLTLAASVAGVAVAVWVWQGARYSAAALLTSTPTFALSDSVAVMRLRQASPLAAVVQLAPAPSTVELRVMPDVSDAPANGNFSMTLLPVTVDAVRLSPAAPNLIIGKDGFVRAYLDSGSVAPGRYRLLLRRAGATDADEFLIDVRESAASQHAD
jgi:hypothetical protein